MFKYIKLHFYSEHKAAVTKDQAGTINFFMNNFGERKRN